MVKHDTILEQLVHLRTGKALDERIKGNKCRSYQDALKQQEFAFAKLERVKWSSNGSLMMQFQQILTAGLSMVLWHIFYLLLFRLSGRLC